MSSLRAPALRVPCARYTTIALLAAVVISAVSCASAHNQAETSDSTRESTSGIIGDTTRIMARLSALSADSMEGRRAGTAGSARARRWIIGELTAMGVRPLGAAFEQRVTLPARAGSDTVGANVVARIPGRQPNGTAIVLSAHYDHLGVRDGVVFNGADDDASGCVALLTIAERLLKDPPQHDVILAFFDGEEGGMQGSRQFVASGAIPLDRVALDINLDMIARQDGNALWVTGLSHNPQLAAIVDSAERTARIPIKRGHDTKDLKPGDDWTNSSDHAAFHAKGIPFLYLGVEDHPDYHKAGDDANKVDPSFYSATIDFAYHLLRFADRHAPPRTGAPR